MITARPTAAPITMPATVSLESEWPAVEDLDSCADKTDCVDVEVSVGLSDEKLVGAVAWPELSPEEAMEEEEVKEGRLVVCAAPVIPEGRLVGIVVEGPE